jgi:hypothetical protein
MISTFMYLLFSASHCIVHNSTIHDRHLKTYIGHKITSLDKATIDMEALLFPSPLYTWVVYKFVPFGPRPTIPPHQPCLLIITYTMDRVQIEMFTTCERREYYEKFRTYEWMGPLPRSGKYTEFLGLQKTCSRVGWSIKITYDPSRIINASRIGMKLVVQSLPNCT